MQAGPRNLITDVAGLRVGNADDSRLKSGVSVVTAEAPFSASYAVMGGAPGTRDTDLLAPDKTVPGVDALILSGGSAFGLSAADGVMAGLLAQGRGFEVGSAKVPIIELAGSTNKSSAVACLNLGSAANAGLIVPKSVRSSSSITTAF